MIDVTCSSREPLYQMPDREIRKPSRRPTRSRYIFSSHEIRRSWTVFTDTRRDVHVLLHTHTHTHKNDVRNRINFNNRYFTETACPRHILRVDVCVDGFVQCHRNMLLKYRLLLCEKALLVNLDALQRDHRTRERTRTHNYCTRTLHRDFHYYFIITYLFFFFFLNLYNVLLNIVVLKQLLTVHVSAYGTALCSVLRESQRRSVIPLCNTLCMFWTRSNIMFLNCVQLIYTHVYQYT